MKVLATVEFDDEQQHLAADILDKHAHANILRSNRDDALFFSSDDDDDHILNTKLMMMSLFGAFVCSAFDASMRPFRALMIWSYSSESSPRLS